jgi:LAO/AO transport system kinase
MTGIDTIWKTVLRHREIFTASHELEEKRRRQAADWMWSMIDEGLKERFVRQPEVKKQLPRILRQIDRGTLSPTAAADQLLFLLDN